MSRIGKKPVPVPAGVDIAIDGRRISVSGKKGTLAYEHRPEVSVDYSKDDKAIAVTIDDRLATRGEFRAYWGMTRALINNMVVGVTEGYEKRLEVVGVGYTAQIQGDKLALKVGFANTVEVDIPSNLDVSVDRQFVNVKGADKQAVGQFAAAVRAVRKPEPYNGKGIMYYGEVIRRKQGKAFGS